MGVNFGKFEILSFLQNRPKASRTHTNEEMILLEPDSHWIIRAAEEYLKLVIVNVKDILRKQGNAVFSIVCIPDAETQAEYRGYVSDENFLEAKIIKPLTPEQEELFGTAAAEEDFRILHLGRTYPLIIGKNEFSITPLLAWKIENSA